MSLKRQWPFFEVLGGVGGIEAEAAMLGSADLGC